MDIKELRIPDPIIDTNPTFEIQPSVHTTRYDDVLGWAAIAISILMLCGSLFVSLVG
jgi:hypothetical protein